MDFQIAMQDVYDLFHDINSLLLARGLKRLEEMLRPAAMSGLISDLLTASLANHARSLTENGYFNGHPDLIVAGFYPNDRVQAGSEGIEIKSTRKKGGAVDTHGARDQWMCVFVYEVDTETEPARDRRPSHSRRSIWRMSASTTSGATLEESWGREPPRCIATASGSSGSTGSTRPETGRPALAGSFSIEEYPGTPCRSTPNRSRCRRSDNPPLPPRQASNPAPQNGSRTMPSPSGSTPLTNGRRNPCGFRLGCGARARSSFRVGDERMTSPKGTSGRRSPESPGAPLAQVVLNPPLQWLAKHEPGLPHRAGHHADVRELIVCALRTVSATHGHHEPDDLASSFETHCGERTGDDMREQRIGRHDYIRPRHQHRRQEPGPTREEFAQSPQIIGREHRKARQRRPGGPVERRGDSPHAAGAVAKLLLLLGRVLDESVRRVRDHRVDGIPLLLLQPLHAVAVNHLRLADDYGAKAAPGGAGSVRGAFVVRQPIVAAARAGK